MRPSRPPPPSDWQIYRRALVIALLGLGGTAALVSVGGAVEPARVLARFAAPSAPELETRSAPELEPAPLTDALRAKGFHECNPHDPIGLGPYAPFRNLNVGRIAIPQKGGYTDDLGYDVVVHFHGHSPVRKTLVQVARGVAFVGIDKGIGSGRYSKPFENPETWRTLLRSIEGALVKHSGDERAHVRKLGLSAWSAGYGAVNEILKYDADRVDAVVLLDGLHAAWNPAAPKRDGSLRSLSSRTIEPTVRFARRALAGEKLFVFTHSRVDPEKYPSTEATANLLLHELGLERDPVDARGDAFGKTGAAERAGFRLWSYAGTNEAAHCTHIRHIAPALRVIEAAWNTPPMDRSVPNTPAPKLGGGAGEEDDMPVLELVAGEADAGAALAAEAPDTAAETETAPELPAVEPTVNAPPPSTE
jgi:hypothetical protein